MIRGGCSFLRLRSEIGPIAPAFGKEVSEPGCAGVGESSVGSRKDVRCKTRANHGKQDQGKRDAERRFGKRASKNGSDSVHKKSLEPWTYGNDWRKKCQ